MYHGFASKPNDDSRLQRDSFGSNNQYSFMHRCLVHKYIMIFGSKSTILIVEINKVVLMQHHDSFMHWGLVHKYTMVCAAKAQS